VLLVSSNFLKDARSAAADWLMPNIRIVTLPSDKWYRLRATAKELRPLVEAAFNPIIDALTKPLTAEEAKPQQKPAVDYPPVRITGDNYEDAVEKFNVSFLENKMGDGLPLVSTAGNFTLLIMVNGPIAKEINMNSGIGLLNRPVHRKRIFP